MSLKKQLKSFFEPNWYKLYLLFFFEFLLTFSSLLFGDYLSDWVFLLSPSALYLESMVDYMLSNQAQLALHGAVSNIIALAYLYFLSCLLFSIYKRLRKK